MVEIKAVTYEETRSDFLKAEMEKAQNRMKFWQTKIKKAKNAVAEMEAHDNASNAGWEYNFYKDALEALAAQPKWISVGDEQKPRHGKEYLCVCALPNDPKHEWDWIMVLRWYSHGSNGLVDRPHFADEGVNGMYVTHWMPTPKLPKEEA